MESKHNYESLTNELLFLNINGASRMVITFDERSSTEDGWVSLQHPQLILCGSCFRNIFDFHASSCSLRNGSPRGFLGLTRLFLVFLCSVWCRHDAQSHPPPSAQTCCLLGADRASAAVIRLRMALPHFCGRTHDYRPSERSALVPTLFSPRVENGCAAFGSRAIFVLEFFLQYRQVYMTFG